MSTRYVVMQGGPKRLGWARGTPANRAASRAYHLFGPGPTSYCGVSSWEPQLAVAVEVPPGQPSCQACADAYLAAAGTHR